jgi:hypothetical protein
MSVLAGSLSVYLEGLAAVISLLKSSPKMTLFIGAVVVVVFVSATVVVVAVDVTVVDVGVGRLVVGVVLVVVVVGAVDVVIEVVDGALAVVVAVVVGFDVDIGAEGTGRLVVFAEHALFTQTSEIRNSAKSRQLFPNRRSLILSSLHLPIEMRNSSDTGSMFYTEIIYLKWEDYNT